MRSFQAQGLFSFVVKPLGLYSIEWAQLHFLLQPDSSSSVIHSCILVFGFLQAQFLEPGHCKRDSDWSF